MDKPRLLDLFCGAGGCAKGYHDAGFEVVGVDIAPQPHYPYEFHQADALTYPLDGFDVIHASPVCKAYTNLNLSPKEQYEKLIGQVREHLQATKKPYVIENVIGAKKDLQASLMLCGSMFGLRLERHRIFESNILMFPPQECNHREPCISVHGHTIWDYSKRGSTRKDGRVRPGSVPVGKGRDAMGIQWMTSHELSQSIPPAYTHWIGEQLMDYLRQEAIA